MRTVKSVISFLFPKICKTSGLSVSFHGVISISLPDATLYDTYLYI